MLKDFVYSINVSAGNEYPRKDDGLDPYSTWLYVLFENELQSCMRIVVKKPENLIPLESAFLAENPEKQYCVTESNVADWNSVAFVTSLKGAKAAKLNFACVAEYCLNQNFDIVYGMFNDQRKGIGRIYLEAGAEISKKFSGKIAFKDFKTFGKPATFTIIEIKKNSLQKLSEILRS
ncbi:LBL_2463 family protein [Leptospira ainlahdjerensis]